MILSDLTGDDESDPIYRTLQLSNFDRQQDFLNSIVVAAIAADRRYLSQNVIKALNFHAIACLHPNAGEYRPWFVEVGAHIPPPFYGVPALMDDFVNFVNSQWESTEPLPLAAFVLWRLNHIHPFIKAGAQLPGDVTLPELLARDRAEHLAVLQQVDASLATGIVDVTPLQNLLQRLLAEQFATVGIQGEHDAAAP